MPPTATCVKEILAEAFGIYLILIKLYMYLFSIELDENGVNRKKSLEESQVYWPKFSVLKNLNVEDKQAKNFLLGNDGKMQSETIFLKTNCC